LRTKLKPSERVALAVQKHWSYAVRPIVVALALYVLLFAVLWPGGATFGDLGGWRTLLVAFVTITVAAALATVYASLARRVNIWVVTDLRVIAESGVFTHQTKESPIEKIHNISYLQSPFGRLLGYGDVQIQTAAEAGATSYSLVSNPRLVKDTITAMQVASREPHAPAAATERPVTQTAPSSGTKECPYCAETIKAKATICRFCGRELKEMRTDTQ